GRGTARAGVPLRRLPALRPARAGRPGRGLPDPGHEYRLLRGRRGQHGPRSGHHGGGGPGVGLAENLRRHAAGPLAADPFPPRPEGAHALAITDAGIASGRRGAAGNVADATAAGPARPGARGAGNGRRSGAAAARLALRVWAVAGGASGHAAELAEPVVVATA